MRVLPCGPHAALLEFETLDDVLAAHARLRGFRGVTDVVPAARTLLVIAPSVAGIEERVGAAMASHLAPSGRAGREVEVPVAYDGEDLKEVARLTGLDIDEVVAAHTGTPWLAAFGGFAPGFVYLVGGDARLRVPRLASPRTRVPAGAVALADEFSGVYPTSSPGGWRLIGSTDAALFDPGATPPSLIAPGDTVRFVAVERRAAADLTERCGQTDVRAPGGPESSSLRAFPSDRRRHLVVERSLLPVLVQDRGRPGLGAIGVSASGAADRGAYELGQRMVGNERGEAALEITMGQVAFTAAGTMTAVMTGAPCPTRVAPASGERGGGALSSVPRASRAVSHATVFTIGDGETLTLGTPTAGLRTYLSLRGGVDVAPVLGSRSRDTLGGLGPEPLRTGDAVRVGRGAPGWAPAIDHVPQAPWPDLVVLRYLPGPRGDWVEGLAGSAWTVGDAVDRVGARLVGSPLARRGGELPSEGAVRGAIQLPPSGQPVLFLADHPPTGGYPVVGVLTDDSADRAAQLRPGDRLRLDPA